VGIDSPIQSGSDKEQNLAQTNGFHRAIDSLESNAKQDPVFSFLWKWRNPISALVLLAILVVVYQSYSEEALKNSMKEAARVLYEGRNELTAYDRLLTEIESVSAKLKEAENSGGAKEEAKATQADLESQLKKLSEDKETALARARSKFEVLADSRGAYGAIGKSYQVLLAFKTGDSKQALKLAEILGWANLKAGAEQRDYYELAYLFTARKLLDLKDQRETGIKMLEQLAREGSRAQVSAAETLAILARSESEQQKVVGILEEILKAHPEQAEVIEATLDRLRS